MCANARTPSCGAEHFPRTDPAVIMLVHDGDRCLLGHHVRWTIPMHSTLAGFVEPGESLEDAVAREIYEEAGIEVDDVDIPLLAALAVPRLDHARLLCPRGDDRHHARPGGAAESPAGSPATSCAGRTTPTQFRMPRADSIARRLIQDWIDAG